MTISEFILARVAEDETVVAEMERMYPGLARDYGSRLDADYGDIHIEIGISRVLAECLAKRSIVHRHRNCGTGVGYCDDGGHGWDDDDPGCGDLASLAAIYSDHGDYQQGWRL